MSLISLPFLSTLTAREITKTVVYQNKHKSFQGFSHLRKLIKVNFKFKCHWKFGMMAFMHRAIISSIYSISLQILTFLYTFQDMERL